MTKYVAFFLHPTYRSLQHFSQLFFPNWNWTHLLSLAEWEQSENIWLSSPSLLRWENILNHFLQNLLSNNLKKGEILSFWQTSFLNFRVEKLFSSRSKNGTGNGVSRFRRMDKRQLWEKLLSHVAPCTFYVLTIIYQETIVLSSPWLLLIDMIDCGICWINKSDNLTYQMIPALHSKRQIKWSTENILTCFFVLDKNDFHFIRRDETQHRFGRLLCNYNRKCL